MRLSRRDTPDDGWESEASSGLALAGFLSLVFVAFTVLVMGPLASLDAYFNLEPPPARWLPLLHVMDRVGQRAVCLPILAVCVHFVCRRANTWRPAYVAAASVFMLNLVVLLLKLGLGRTAPRTADPTFFNGGMAYPSGHSANIVLVYGLAAYLLTRYAKVGRGTQVLLWGSVAVLAVTMVVTSLTLDWHWFGDLIAGLLVGGVVLQLTAVADHLLPEPGLPPAWWERLRAAAVRPARWGRRGSAAEPLTHGQGLAQVERRVPDHTAQRSVE